MELILVFAVIPGLLSASGVISFLVIFCVIVILIFDLFHEAAQGKKSYFCNKASFDESKVSFFQQKSASNILFLKE